MWNTATGQVAGSPFQIGPGGQGGVNGVAFSPDGSLLAGAYGNGTIRLWNTAAGQVAGSPFQIGPGGRSGVNSVAFSPDGKRLAGAYSNGTIGMWKPPCRPGQQRRLADNRGSCNRDSRFGTGRGNNYARDPSSK